MPQPRPSTKPRHRRVADRRLAVAVLLWFALGWVPLPSMAGFATPAPISSRLTSQPDKTNRTPVVLTAPLERRTRVIVTRSQRADGTTQENRGSSVVVGRFLLTVYHNLRPEPANQFVHVQSFLGGLPIQPLFLDPAADLAIVPIPEALCPSLCDADDDLPDNDTELNATVRWYRDPSSTRQGDPGWHQARVLGRTWSLPATPMVGSLGADCDAGLVFEVDRPFRPGSSGTGVWDAQNRLVGIAQGSFQTRDGTETGYFKPLRCIRGHWPAPLSNNATPILGYHTNQTLRGLAPIVYGPVPPGV